MTEFTVVRAMDVARLTEYQLRQLQDLEKAKRYLLPSWNISSLYSLDSLKRHYFLPDDAETMKAHLEKLKNLIKDKGLLNVEADSHVYSKEIDSVHSFDWGIWYRREELDFSYQSQQKKRGKVLLDLLDNNG